MALDANADLPQDPIDSGHHSGPGPGGSDRNGSYVPHLTFWEPWRPELGSRVTIRYPGECNVDWGRVGDGWSENLGHPPEFDYQVGTVFRVDTEYGAHKYAVVFDIPVPVGRKDGALCRGAHFAAIELEPIDLPDSSTVEDIVSRFRRLRLNDAG